jgi:type IV pilus assembly protein PilA
VYNEKKGFTLVELLAVIVVLAVVLAIAVPSITGIIENVGKIVLKQLRMD